MYSKEFVEIRQGRKKTLTKPRIRLARGIADSLRPRPQLSTSEFADQYVVIPKGVGAEWGRWRTDRVPYLRGMMDAIDLPGVKKIVFMTSAQIGKTSALLNIVYKLIWQERGPILSVFPKEETAEMVSKERFAPAVKAMPWLQEKMDDKGRETKNTILVKYTAAGPLVFVGSNSASNLAGRPANFVLVDEYDRMNPSIKGEGNKIALAIVRTRTFWDSWALISSTPTVKGESPIEDEWELSSKQLYLVPCPHCGFYQDLNWAGFEYPGKGTGVLNIERVQYRCANSSCGKLFGREHQAEMLRQGRWEAQNPGETQSIGFNINAYYSPLADSWESLCQEYETALDDPEKLKVWHNTTLGLPFEMQGEKVEWELLMERAKSSNYYMGELPEGVLHLTAGVDVQKDRLEVAIYGWQGRKSWLIEYHVLDTNAELSEQNASVWQRLHDLLSAPRVNFWGERVHVKLAFVDSGAFTFEVYCQLREWRKDRNPIWRPIKGLSNRTDYLVSKGKWVDINYEGETLHRRGVKLHTLNVWDLKLSLYARSKSEKMFHLPRDVPEQWCKGFCAEVLVTEPNGHQYWHKKGPNEAVDNGVYALAAAIAAEIPSQVNAGKIVQAKTEAAGDSQPVATAEENKPTAPQKTPSPKRKTTGKRGFNPYTRRTRY